MMMMMMMTDDCMDITNVSATETTRNRTEPRLTC